MKELVLHIGTEKTGTTSIQEFLALNRANLKNAGILYPASLGQSNHVRLAACADIEPWRLAKAHFKIVNKDSFLVFRHHVLQKFQLELQESNCQRVIISNEHLHSHVNQSEQFLFLKDILEKNFSSIKILIYFRRQDLMAVSRYYTALKVGFIPSGHFDVSTKDYYFNFFSIYQNWAQHFGAENINVRIFSKEKFLNHNLIDDFCSSAEIGNTNGFYLPNRENSSLSMEAECLLIELNKRIIEKKLELTDNQRTHLIEQFSKQFKGNIRFPIRELATNFYHAFDQSNADLQQKLNMLDEPLFNTDFAMYPLVMDTALFNEKQIWAQKELNTFLP